MIESTSATTATSIASRSPWRKVDVVVPAAEDLWLASRASKDRRHKLLRARVRALSKKPRRPDSTTSRRP